MKSGNEKEENYDYQHRCTRDEKQKLCSLSACFHGISPCSVFAI